MKLSRKKKRRKMYALLRALSCIMVLAALVLVIHVFTGFLDRSLPGKSSTSSPEPSAALGAPAFSDSLREIANFSQSLLPALNLTDNQRGITDQGEQDEENTEKGQAGEGSGDGQGEENPGSGQGEEGSEGGQGEEGSEGSQPGSTSHTISNTPIDLASLSTSAEGWGPGTDCDEKNRPHSALSYQEKYGKYNAHFIVPDSDKIYLTFDEGYENGRTADILNVLKEKNTQAVFFVTLPYAKQNPDLIQRMIDEGHTVGAHSVTHPAQGLPSQTIEQQQKEITELHDYIKDNFNYEMHLFRFPAGIFSEQSLAIVNNCNYKSVFWSFAYLDYDTENQPDPAQALDKLKSRLHPGAIYLLHAVSSTNASILGDFIDCIGAEGYEIGLFD